MSKIDGWSVKKRQLAVSLRENGYSYREIARRIGGGATASGVLKVCRKNAEHGSVADRRKLKPATPRDATRPSTKHTLWSPKKRAIAITLRREGYSYRQVARRIGEGATASGVQKLMKKFEQTASVADKKRSGRPRITSTRQDRSII